MDIIGRRWKLGSESFLSPEQVLQVPDAKELVSRSPTSQPILAMLTY